MMFLAIKTEDGAIKGKISFCCRMLKVARQGFYKYPADKDRSWKYQDSADAMRAVASEDECNDAYGRICMYQALLLKQPEGIRIPGGRTVVLCQKKVQVKRELHLNILNYTVSISSFLNSFQYFFSCSFGDS